MKILALTTNTSRISWISVEGSQKEPSSNLKLSRINLADDVDSGEGLSSLIQTIEMLLETEKPTAISVLQAGKSRFNNTSPKRIKVEAAVQIAAANRHIDARLISPATIAARKKRLERDGTSLEKLVNSGNEFASKDLSDAVGAGFESLPNE